MRRNPVFEDESTQKMFEETVFESFWTNPAISQLRNFGNRPRHVPRFGPRSPAPRDMALQLDGSDVMDHRTNRQFREICWG